MNFVTFPVETTNVFPMANSTSGGQLLTEFNLRSRESVMTPASIQYMTGLSYTHSLADYAISHVTDSLGNVLRDTAKIKIAEGRCVLNGHFVESLAPIIIDIAAANAQLKKDGQPVLSGTNIKVGLRTMYSTVPTMAGALMTENDQDFYEGIQVVVLPEDKFKLPIDCPDNPNLVTAHLYLGKFDFMNNQISNLVSAGAEKIQMLSADRISDVDGYLDGRFVTSRGLNEKHHYVYSGNHGWCEADDALIVWDSNPELVSGEATTDEAHFRFDASSDTTQLVLPHKQPDEMHRTDSTSQHYMDTILTLPSASYSRKTGGVVDRTYTDNIHRLSRMLERLYMLPPGGLKLYIEELDDRGEQLPSLTVNHNWKVGDYVLVGADHTLEEDTDDVEAPSTMYVIMPGKVTQITNKEIFNDGGRKTNYRYYRPSNLTGELTWSQAVQVMVKDIDWKSEVASALAESASPDWNTVIKNAIDQMGFLNDINWSGIISDAIEELKDKDNIDWDKVIDTAWSTAYSNYMNKRDTRKSKIAELKATLVEDKKVIEHQLNEVTAEISKLNEDKDKLENEREACREARPLARQDGELLWRFWSEKGIEDETERLPVVVNKDSRTPFSGDFFRKYVENYRQDPQSGAVVDPDDFVDEQEYILFEDYDDKHPKYTVFVWNKNDKKYRKGKSVNDPWVLITGLKEVITSNTLWPANTKISKIFNTWKADVLAAGIGLNDKFQHVPYTMGDVLTGMRRTLWRNFRENPYDDGEIPEWADYTPFADKTKGQLDNRQIIEYVAEALGNDQLWREITDADDTLVNRITTIKNKLAVIASRRNELDSKKSQLTKKLQIVTDDITAAESELSQAEYEIVLANRAFGDDGSYFPTSSLSELIGGRYNPEDPAIDWNSVIKSAISDSIVNTSEVEWQNVITDALDSTTKVRSINWDDVMVKAVSKMIEDTDADMESILSEGLPEHLKEGLELGRENVDSSFDFSKTSAIYELFGLTEENRDNADYPRGRVDLDYFVIVQTIEHSSGTPEYRYFYYTVTGTKDKKYSDPPLRVTGPMVYAEEETIGGFLNVPDTQLGAGYVYRNPDGYLQLLDYDLLATGVLAYQLGENFVCPAGLASSEIQSNLDEYVNNRVAFPNANHIQQVNEQYNQNVVSPLSDVSVIHIYLDVSAEESPYEINVQNIDTRFNTSVYLHISGDADYRCNINILNCQKIRLDIKTSSDVKINLYDSCLYYDADVIDKLNFISNMSLWYAKFSLSDANLLVDGMSVELLDPLQIASTVEYWVESSPNDNHYKYALKGITLSANGEVVGAKLYVTDDITADIQVGTFISVFDFKFPQGVGLPYPVKRLNNQIKITGQFITAYPGVADTTPGYYIKDTEFTALSYAQTLSSYNPNSTSDRSLSGVISFRTNIEWITQFYTNIEGTTSGLPIDGWESGKFHVFEGGVVN